MIPTVEPESIKVNDEKSKLSSRRQALESDQAKVNLIDLARDEDPL
jgi:hypothetical protein